MSDPLDPLAEVRPARLDEETRAVLSRVADSLQESAAAQQAVAKELKLVRPGLERGLRASWLALAALAVVVLTAVGGFGTWAYLYQQSACERGNEARARDIDMSEVIVYETARDLESDADARARSRRVAARVAEDPRLAQQEC